MEPGTALRRGRAALVFAPLVVVSMLACSNSGSSRDRPAGVGNQGTSGGVGGAGNSGGRGGRATGGTSGGTGEAGDGSGGTATGGSGAVASGGRGAAGGDGAVGGDTGNEAGAPGIPEGPEVCSDGFDNDRDGYADCSDDECVASCQAACEGVVAIEDPSTVPGSNVGHAVPEASDCGAMASGPAVVYRLTADTTGMLEVSATGSGLFRVSVRAACDEGEALGCGLGGTSVSVTAGDELFVVVQGLEASDAGNFTLTVLSRAVGVCGDGYRDPPEGCDDENDEPGDGCDAACAVETKESEPNESLATADEYEDPHFAEIDPEGDVDNIAFVLATRASAVVSTENLGDGACTFGTLDSFVEVFDESGDSLGTDDDGGEGLCARLILPNLPAGRYTAQVTAAATGDTPTFPYRLLVFTDICGNGKKTVAEACDDGNAMNGDGCSATCQVE
jgi:cysteine-rich repeat protein